MSAVSQLIDQIKNEARTELLEELSLKRGTIVLAGLNPETRRLYLFDDHIYIEDGAGNEIRVYRSRFEPESWRGQAHMAGVWHPARWGGSQEMRDCVGRTWRNELPTMVCDDFGHLVEVQK